MADSSLPHMTQKGLWAISIGFTLVGGKRTQRKHWLGRDKDQARRLSRALHIAWENETAVDPEGKKVWTPESIAAAFAFAQPPNPSVQLAAPAPVQVVPNRPYTPPQKPATPTLTKFTLPEALEEYRKAFAARTDIGERHRKSNSEYLDSIIARLDQVKLHGSNGSEVLVGHIEMEWLVALRNYVTGRPDSKLTKKPISTTTATHWLMALGCAFAWMDRTPRIGWRAPHPEWRKNFYLSKKQKYSLQSADERDSEGKPGACFTVDQLVGVYRNTSPLGRKYLLMGMLLGWSQEAINSFRKSHFVMVGGEYFIDRRRGKTGVPGFWWVAPELAAILIRSMQETPHHKDGLAFLTDNGLALCERTDSIRQTWDRALNTAPEGTPTYSFGKVKKTGAQLVQNVGSHELAQLFLAHEHQTVAAAHYVSADANVGLGKSPYEKLHDVQKAIWAELQPLFFPAKVQTQQTEGVAA